MLGNVDLLRGWTHEHLPNRGKCLPFWLTLKAASGENGVGASKFAGGSGRRRRQKLGP